MTPSEATMLARLARAACPQQHFDEYTPDMWYDLLGDLTFDDAREGLARAAKAKPFVAPAEIRQHVKAIRTERLANADLAIPAVDPDAKDYSRRLQAHIAALADGRAVPPAIGDGHSDTPGEDYRQARERHARTRPRVAFPEDWCGRCDSEARVRYELTGDGTGLRAVPCPDCRERTWTA